MFLPSQWARIGIALVLCVCPGGAQPRDQKWIDSQRAFLQREQALQRARLEDLDKAANEGWQRSFGRINDWIKDNLAAGDPKGVMLGGDTALPLYLMWQNFDMYKQAVRGDTSSYVKKLGEAIFSEIVERLPEKLHLGWLDPTHIEQLVDLKQLRDLKANAEQIDAIEARLERIQQLIDNAQRDLLSSRASKPATGAVPSIRTTPVSEKDYSELDKAIADMKQTDMANQDEFNQSKSAAQKQGPGWDPEAYQTAMKKCRSTDAPERSRCIAIAGGPGNYFENMKAATACSNAANAALKACGDAAAAQYAPKK